MGIFEILGIRLVPIDTAISNISNFPNFPNRQRRGAFPQIMPNSGASEPPRQRAQIYLDYFLRASLSFPSPLSRKMPYHLQIGYGIVKISICPPYINVGR